MEFEVKKMTAEERDLAVEALAFALRTIENTTLTLGNSVEIKNAFMLLSSIKEDIASLPVQDAPATEKPSV
jgi:hypothetical protein